MAKRQVDVTTEDEMEDDLTSEERYATIVEVLLGYPEVTFGGSDKRSFGASALKVRGKIFAMIDSKDEFVVKLPRQRVDNLIAANAGSHFDPGHGRLMKEWLAVEPMSTADWLALAKEAMEFVLSKS
ncbi:MAG: hypothetical protein ABI947_08560 [Chloroflexota bacterium]